MRKMNDGVGKILNGTTMIMLMISKKEGKKFITTETNHFKRQVERNRTSDTSEM